MSWKLQGPIDNQLRQFHQRLTDLERMVSTPQAKPLTLDDIRSALSASGTHPLNITSLPGQPSQTPPAHTGLAAARPKSLNANQKGTLYYAYDTKVTSYWNGSAWV